MDIAKLARDLRERKHDLVIRRQRIAADLCRTRELHGSFSDQVAQRYNDDVLKGILATADQELSQIDNALRRIDEGTYDTCARCGSTVPPARLAVVPFTDHCASCATSAAATAPTNGK
jgi:DnaK suppressor protein